MQSERSWFLRMSKYRNRSGKIHIQPSGLEDPCRVTVWNDGEREMLFHDVYCHSFL